jgi:hypothetical protein
MMNEAFSTLSCSDFDVNSILMIFTSKLESTLKLVSEIQMKNLFPRSSKTNAISGERETRWRAPDP